MNGHLFFHPVFVNDRSFIKEKWQEISFVRRNLSVWGPLARTIQWESDMALPWARESMRADNEGSGREGIDLNICMTKEELEDSQHPCQSHWKNKKSVCDMRIRWNEKRKKILVLLPELTQREKAFLSRAWSSCKMPQRSFSFRDYSFLSLWCLQVWFTSLFVVGIPSSWVVLASQQTQFPVYDSFS